MIPPAKRVVRFCLWIIALGAAASGIIVMITSGTIEQRLNPMRPRSQEITRRDTPPVEGFVGSHACAECHPGIAESYSAHPMANSCGSVHDVSTVEDYGNAEFMGPDNRRYWIERDAEGGIRHHESLSDEQGLLYDQAVKIDYVLGSGRHGRAFLHEENGKLFQSPITWYAGRSKWDFSPGYEPRSHVRFERQVGDGCLYCHVGRVNHVKGDTDVYASPPFAEATIGCERCHGPAEKHILHWRSSERSESSPDPIVNPGKLASNARDAVCFVCHLQGRFTVPRLGRSFLDFHPGGRIDDAILIYVDDSRVDSAGRVMPVSQVEQMLASRCYKGSEGQLGCTSCHDPHGVPPPEERIRFFRQRCLDCHEQQGCSAPQAERDAAPWHDSCMACHMPRLETRDVAHTALTDHRVIRRREESVAQSSSINPSTMPLFGDEDRLPSQERSRGRGLLLLEAAQRFQSAPLARQAFEQLLPKGLQSGSVSDVMEVVGSDAATVDGMALSLWLHGRQAEAATFWRALLDLDPAHERALYYLAIHAQAKGDLQETLLRLDQLAAAAPYISDVHLHRAQVLARLGRRPEAIVAARRGLELSPTRMELRELLIELYRSTGQNDLADRELERQQRIVKALQR